MVIFALIGGVMSVFIILCFGIYLFLTAILLLLIIAPVFSSSSIARQ
jgi:hypothetical protein